MSLARFFQLQLAVGGFVGALVWWDSGSVTAAVIAVIIAMAGYTWLAMAAALLNRAP